MTQPHTQAAQGVQPHDRSLSCVAHTAMLSSSPAGVRGLVTWDWQLPFLEAHFSLRQGDLEIQPWGQGFAPLSSLCSLGLGIGLHMQWGWGGQRLLWAGGLHPEPWRVSGWPLRLSQGHGAAGSPPSTHSLGWLGSGSVQRPHSGARARFPGRVGWVSRLLQMKRFPSFFPLPPDEHWPPEALLFSCPLPWRGCAPGARGSVCLWGPECSCRLAWVPSCDSGMLACAFACHVTSCV